MGRKEIVLAFALGLAGCAGGGQSGGVSVGVTLYPINSAAGKYGVLRTTYLDPGNFTASIKLDTGREVFEAQAMTVDNGYSGWGSVYSMGNATGFSGGMGASAFGSSVSTSHTTTRANSLRGVADGHSTSGKRIQCEYVVNLLGPSTGGTCRISDGALFRFYAKPL